MMIPTTLAEVSLTAGTPVAVTANTALYARAIVIQGGATQASGVYWGGSNCTSTNGQYIATAAAVSIGFDSVYGTNPRIKLSEVYLATDVSANKVRIVYFPWTGGP